MTDKETILISIIIIILGAVISYRIEYIDNELDLLKIRVDKISEKAKPFN